MKDGNDTPELPLTDLLQEHDRAAAEVARLSRADDRGSGERTARLASLGAWEMRQASLARSIIALAGTPDVEAARARLGRRDGD